MDLTELRRIGMSWFVSYSYYLIIDSTHRNWENVDTLSLRKSKYNSTKKYHKDWLYYITEISPKRLDLNTINLTGNEIVDMAIDLLMVIDKENMI